MPPGGRGGRWMPDRTAGQLPQSCTRRRIHRRRELSHGSKNKHAHASAHTINEGPRRSKELRSNAVDGTLRKKKHKTAPRVAHGTKRHSHIPPRSTSLTLLPPPRSAPWGKMNPWPTLRLPPGHRGALHIAMAVTPPPSIGARRWEAAQRSDGGHRNAPPPPPPPPPPPRGAPRCRRGAARSMGWLCRRGRSDVRARRPADRRHLDAPPPHPACLT